MYKLSPAEFESKHGFEQFEKDPVFEVALAKTKALALTLDSATTQFLARVDYTSADEHVIDPCSSFVKLTFDPATHTFAYASIFSYFSHGTTYMYT